MFGALSVSDVAGVFTHDLTPTVSSPGAAQALGAASRAHGTRLRCHLKIDTGLNRLGFRHDNLDRTLPTVLGDAALDIEAMYTHFATADEPEQALFEAQRLRFEAARTHGGAARGDAPARARGQQRGLPPRLAHVGRSGAARTAALRRGAAAAGGDAVAHAGDDVVEPGGRREGGTCRRGRRLRRAPRRRRARDPGRRSRRLRRRPRPAARRDAARCWCAVGARRSSAPSAWTC